MRPNDLRCQAASARAPSRATPAANATKASAEGAENPNHAAMPPANAEIAEMGDWPAETRASEAKKNAQHLAEPVRRARRTGARRDRL